MYRGATTSGNRKVASPSSHGSGPVITSRTVTRSPGSRFPTRMVNTPGRSSSAIDALRPSSTAASYSALAWPRSLSTPSITRPPTSMWNSVTAARSGSGKM
jgi:hypothetical protein